MINFSSIEINRKTKKNIKRALKDGFIGQGSFITEFENKIKDLFGVKHAFFVANGTLADASALVSLKILKPDCNEVILPALTFIAQANSVLMAGLKPVFVDVDNRMQIDYTKIEEKINNKTLTIFPAHLMGWTASIKRIKEIADKYNLFLVEDSCEAFGACYKDKLIGTFGDVGTFSFFVSHALTSGEGGLIITDRDDLADIIKSVINHGRKSEKPLEKFQFPYFGFNAKGTNLEAAILCSLIDNVFNKIEKRQENVGFFNYHRNNFDFIEQEFEYISPHAYPIQTLSKLERDRKMLELISQGIDCRTLFSYLPDSPQFKEFTKDQLFPKAKDFSERYYYIPCHQSLNKKDLEYILSKI